MFEHYASALFSTLVATGIAVLCKIVGDLFKDVLCPAVSDYYKKKTCVELHSTTVKYTECTSKTNNYGSGLTEISPEHRVLIRAVSYFLTKNNLVTGTSNCSVAWRRDDADRPKRAIAFMPSEKCTYRQYSFVFNTVMRENERDEYLIVTSKSKENDIHPFLQARLEEYEEFLAPKKQIYYEQVEHEEQLSFAKYRLEVSTTFDDIFFNDKEEVIRNIELLEEGKIKKLIILAHGPPGTGKTSLQKAILSRTGRHAVTLKLGSMKNDTMLKDAFFQDTIISRSGTSIAIPLSERMISLEDIDAECDWILKRTEAVQPENKSISASDVTTKEKANVSRPTLTGILNVLDGISELRDAIVVITTNHIDKLDPALTRDGRVTMKLYMGELNLESANQLVAKFFGRTSKIIKGGIFTGAKLEAICLKSKNFNHFEQQIDAYQTGLMQTKVQPVD